MDVANIAPYIQSVTYEPISEYVEFPRTNDPVWILGKKYSTLHDMEDIQKFMLSRLWFTYRKGFSSIGGNGPQGDQGWGCMLRCGQMMLGQTLILRHLSRDWLWEAEKYDPKYHEILRMFQDKKSSNYSIHQIASMGLSEGKTIGSWFGPNTIAHVMRKLAVYDEWSSLIIHVAMDNTVIKDDIKKLCKSKCCSCLNNLKRHSKSHSSKQSHSRHKTNAHYDSSHSHTMNGVEVDDSLHCSPTKDNCCQIYCKSHWKPLLLLIPLRLGLTEINPVYSESLKECLRIKQSVGIIGGKPNHAHYFIGSVGDDLVFLDPHTVQPFVDLAQPGETDESYHCPYISQLNINQLDPSIAVGFYCESADEFEDLCLDIKMNVIEGRKTPMFEIHERRPSHWPPFEAYMSYNDQNSRTYDTDEEFELIS